MTKRKPQKSGKKQKYTKKRYTTHGGVEKKNKMSYSERLEKDRLQKRHKKFLREVIEPFQNEDFDDEKINEMIKNDKDYSKDLVEEHDKQEKHKKTNTKGSKDIDSFEFDEKMFENI